jgi:outer membrane protein assembly factor BamA
MVNFWYGCSVTNRVPENEFLLSNNRLIVDNLKLNKEEILTIVKQRPNRRILKTIRFHLRAYNVASVFRDSGKIRSWLQNSVGEEPVILDTNLTARTTQQINLYLKNKGYYNNQVSDTTIYFGKQARVIYKIKSGIPYTIGTFNYSIHDSLIRSYVLANANNTLIKFGDNFDVDILEAERFRITEILKNNGFYFFNKEFLEYEADSVKRKVNIVLKLRSKDEIKLNIPNPNIDIFSPYTITNVIIDTDFDTRNPNYIHTDSLRRIGYVLNYNGRLEYNPEIILRSIFFQQGDIYSDKAVADTYQSLSELKAFRYVNITFQPDKWDIGNKNLKCNIQLSPVIPKSYSISTEGTNSSGNLGVNGNLIFQNKNTNKGAQILEFKIYGGLEVQRLLVSQSALDSSAANNQITEVLDKTPIKNTFNTFEISPSLSYEVPQFFPFKAGLLPKKSQPHTIFSSSYNYQVRPDFSRTVFNASLAWRFKPFQKSKFFNQSKLFIYPFDLNIISIVKSEAFLKKIVETKNTGIKLSFTDVFIPANKISFTINTQDVNTSYKNHHFFKLDLEQAGAILQMLNKNGIINSKQTSRGTYYLFEDIQGVPKPYAQYVKADVDYRFFQNFINNSSFVYRIFTGISKPYGNSGTSLPFQKSYFSGGTNDVRAFRARSIGPGEYNAGSANTFNKIGDIKLLGNVEYRFTIYKAWKGAVFTDGGNIWIYHADSLRPGAEFKFENFYKQIAIGSGVGLRYDFDFFIVRLDMATPLYDPILPEGSRRVYSHILDKTWREQYEIVYGTKFNPVTFNLGIGYPF